MNTLKFGNGEWYGKKDTILAYNDLNSNYKPLPFNFSRASKATVINKDGLIEEVGSGQPRIDYKDNSKGALKLEPQRTNKYLYSQDFSNPYWTKSGASIQGNPSTLGSELVTNGSFTGSASGWALGSGWAYSSNVINATSTSSVCYQDIAAMQSNKTYTVTYQISNYSGGNIQWRFGGTGTVDGATRNANGTYTESFTNTSSGDKRLFLSPSGFTGTIDNVSVKEVQGFTSPDGTLNGFKLVGDGANSTHLLRRYIGATALTTHSFSFFVKKGEITKLGIREDAQTGNYVSFDLETKTIITEVSMTLTYEEVGDYLKLKIVSQIGSNGTAGYAIYMLDDTYSGGVVNGSRVIPNGSGIYIYGAQLEAGSYSTSYIPTSGSAVTRLDDSCSQTVPDGVIGQTEGTMYAEYYFDATIDNTGGSDRNILEIRDVSSSDRIQMVHYGNGAGSAYKKVYCYAVVASSYVVTIISGVYDSGTMKVAIGYKNNDYVLYVNGVQIGTDTSAGVPSCSKIYLQPQSGTLTTTKTSDVQIYNTRLSNSELAALTS